MTKLEQLRVHQAEQSGTMKALTDRAEAENNRPLTPEENEQFDKASETFDFLSQEIARYERAAQAVAQTAAPQPRATADYTPPANASIAAPSPRITGGTHASANFANRGFEKGIGEFFMAVRKVAMTNIVDTRLIHDAVTTYGSGGTNADGGFGLPPQFNSGFMDAVIPQESFLNALNPVYTNSNMLVVPANENPAWGASGITAAKTSEGGQITQSKPAVRQVTVVLHAIKSLVSVSDEALEDMPFLASWVQQQMADHVRYKLENYIVNGTGENEPLGFYYAPGIKSVADGDSTATMLGQFDALTMEAGLLKGGGAPFWVAGPTVLPAVGAMKTGSAGYPLVQPDMTVATRRALNGRPYYESEACKAWNTLGDLYLVNPAGYIFAMKASGVQTASTSAWAFDQNLSSFRCTLRAGGAPLLSAVVTRGDGTSTASHIVTIAGSRS